MTKIEQFVSDVDAAIAKLERTKNLALNNAPDLAVDESMPPEEKDFLSQGNRQEDVQAIWRGQEYARRFGQSAWDQVLRPVSPDSGAAPPPAEGGMPPGG